MPTTALCTMIVIPSDAHNTVFGRILKDIFHFSVLYYSIIAFRLKALSTNQKDWTVFNFFWSPFSLWTWFLLFIWRTCLSCVTWDMKEAAC